MRNFSEQVWGEPHERGHAVIDPDGGGQPLASTDGSCAVAFNGELYVHQEIRRGLDYAFRSSCDTELLLALHRPDDDQWLGDIPGMFAFALWDDRRGRLTCARDWFGEKPFYYSTTTDGSLLFASEVGSLLASGLVDPELDEHAIGHYLQHGYVHPSESVYRAIKVLAPGHALRWEDGQVRVWRYWTPPAIDESMSRVAAVDGLRERLSLAVARQLEADVPVGVFLSGGPDSSTIAALAADHAADLQTFTFGFDDESDERAYAAEQATAIGSSHRSYGEDGLDPVATLLALQSVYDEPFADASAVPTWVLAGRAREHVKVVLGGDGADELLGGYLFWSRRYLREHSDVRLPELVGGRRRRTRDRWSRHRSLAPAYQGFRRYFDHDEQRRLGLVVDTSEYLDTSRYGTGEVSDLLRMDLDTYLPGDILVKTDRASMAHGLELRSPFLDQEVASFCLQMPDRHKVDEGSEKVVLREAFGDRWVPDVRNRPKQGFSGPMERWLRDERVQPLIRHYLEADDSPLGAILDMSGVRGFAAGVNQQAWTLLCLGLWFDHRRRRSPVVEP